MHFIFIILINTLITIAVSSALFVYIKKFSEAGLNAKIQEISSKVKSLNDKVETDLENVVSVIAARNVESEFENAKRRFEQFLSFIF